MQRMKTKMLTAIDLFAGIGGWSTGAKMAGVKVLWAANHWQDAVNWHQANHPETEHACQDLHQANWEQVPGHDLLLASPCCHGHSNARGKANGNPQHDASRATAWAVLSALEFHKPAGAIVENVKGFLDWVLYPAWRDAVEALGYCVAPHVVDCADLGVPQNRIRLFLVITRSKAPLMPNFEQCDHVPATSFINFDAGNWTSIENKPGRAAATIARAVAGRKRYGERFVMPFYGSGSGKTGRSVDRPIGTITTCDRWSIVNGDKMRIMTAGENMLAMSFPTDTLRPDNHRLTVHLAGNAVPPVAAFRVIEAFKAAL